MSPWTIFRILHAFLCILQLLTTICLFTLGVLIHIPEILFQFFLQLMLILLYFRKVSGLLKNILKYFKIIYSYLCTYLRLRRNFRIRGVTPENLLGSFLHFGVFFRLLNIIFKKMGIGLIVSALPFLEFLMHFNVFYRLLIIVCFGKSPGCHS